MRRLPTKRLEIGWPNSDKMRLLGVPATKMERSFFPGWLAAMKTEHEEKRLNSKVLQSPKSSGRRACFMVSENAGAIVIYLAL